MKKKLLNLITGNILRKIAMTAFACICSLSLSAQGRITGKVTDESGTPLAGASVVVKGTNTGVSTDVGGNYSVNVTGDVLMFSLVGFTTQEITVGSRTVINVVLEDETTKLDEVIVLGYGAAQRKADLSASIGTIANIETVRTRPVTDVGGMLQGQIPGVTVRNNTGNPTDGPHIIIRGKGSKGNEGVLVVVDGIPGGNYNVDEIENVVVLKDAASAAIYGAQSGSQGVILITTKRAKAGRTAISYDGSFGFSNATHLPQSLTVEDERAVRKASLEAAGSSLPDGWDPVKNPWNTVTRTDWIDEIFRTGLFQRHTVALTGGTDSFSNRLSLNYINKEGTLIGTFNKTYQLRYNAEYTLNKYVKIRENAWVTTGYGRGTGTTDGYGSPTLMALAMPRSAVPYYEDGSIGGTAPIDPEYIAKYGSNFAGIHGDVVSPIRSLLGQDIMNRPLNFNTNTFLEVGNIVPGLRFTSRFKYGLDYGFNKTFTYKRTEPGKPNLSNQWLNYYANRNESWETENTLNYDNSFGDHTIGALASFVATSWQGRDFGVTGRDFENEDANFQYFNYAKSFDVPGSGYDIDRNVSLISRLSYSYKNRYLATATYRRDYAGRLPKGKKYGDFPAVTLGWKLSEESFMPKTNDINLIKLRGSWGRIGNLSSIGNNYGYQSLALWDLGGRGGVVGADNPNVSAVGPAGAFNPYLTWETSETTDFGIDAELFDNRLSFSVDYFNKRTFNLIKPQEFKWPSYIGLGQKLINEGEITNTGFEFLLGWNDKAGDISYFVNANLATLNNKITNIGAPDPATGKKAPWHLGDQASRAIFRPFRSDEGDALNTYWLLKTDGLFQSDEEAAAYVDKDGNRIQPNAKAGDLKFIDQNGDGKLDEQDRVKMGAYFPDVTYALTGGLTYKDVSFSLMLQGVQGSKILHTAMYQTLNENAPSYNRWDRILDAWSPENRGSNIPRLNASDPNENFQRASDWYLEDGSYLRVKNVTVSYDLSRLLHKSSHLNDRKSRLSLTLSVDNLYTFTKYTGMDPEIDVNQNGLDGGGAYPVPRTVSLGIKLTY